MFVRTINLCLQESGSSFLYNYKMARLALLVFSIFLFISKNVIEGNVGFRTIRSEEDLTSNNFEDEKNQDYTLY